MSDRDARMLPGPTARTVHSWATALLIASFSVQGVLAVGSIGLRAFSEPARELSWVNALPTIAIGLVVLYFGLLSGFAVLTSRATRLQNAEVVAGYTSLLGKFDQVDGIDPTTGQVVRPATVRIARAPRADVITTGAELDEVVGVQTPLQIAIALRFPAIGFSTAAVLLLTGIVLTVMARLDGTTDLGAEILVATCLPVSAVTLLYVPFLIRNIIAPRRTLTVVTAHFQGAQVYVGELMDGDKVTELLDPGAARLPGAEYRPTTYFVFDREHLTMYSQHHNQLVPFLAIPRSRVSAVRTTYPRYGFAAPLLTVEKNNGRFVDLIMLLGDTSGVLAKSELVTASERVASWRTAAT